MVGSTSPFSRVHSVATSWPKIWNSLKLLDRCGVLPSRHNIDVVQEKMTTFCNYEQPELLAVRAEQTRAACACIHHNGFHSYSQGTSKLHSGILSWGTLLWGHTCYVCQGGSIWLGQSLGSGWKHLSSIEGEVVDEGSAKLCVCSVYVHAPPHLRWEVVGWGH